MYAKLACNYSKRGQNFMRNMDLWILVVISSIIFLSLTHSAQSQGYPPRTKYAKLACNYSRRGQNSMRNTDLWILVPDIFDPGRGSGSKILKVLLPGPSPIQNGLSFHCCQFWKKLKLMGPRRKIFKNLISSKIQETLELSYRIATWVLVMVLKHTDSLLTNVLYREINTR